MAKYRVTPRAEEDLKSIGRYTHGRHRTDITEGYYSFPEGQHIVFYLCSHDGIDIIGIPHKDMDILSYFQAH